MVRDQRRQRDRNHDARGDEPVVADDEVVPEAHERDDVAHAGAPACAASRARRSSLTAAIEVSDSSARITSSAASLPGHDTPAPSALQNVPKVVSRSPTANFSVFSGTWLRGARTTTPTATTIRSAAPAAAAAIATPWLRAAPNVITMKAPPSPSRKPPLKASVNEYQPSPARRSDAASSASARSRS